MQWSYIAGFVDGEGCFAIGNYGSQMSLTITQREDRAAVLDLIAAEFDSVGITYSWYEGTNQNGCHYWNLIISAQASLKKAVLKLMPYLVVKRADAEAALEWLASKDEARQHRDTFCKYGHKKTEENTYVHGKTGKRSCLACRQARARGLDPAGYSGPK